MGCDRRHLAELRQAGSRRDGAPLSSMNERPGGQLLFRNDVEGTPGGVRVERVWPLIDWRRSSLSRTSRLL
jgi:hypothetical protein